MCVCDVLCQGPAAGRCVFVMCQVPTADRCVFVMCQVPTADRCVCVMCQVPAADRCVFVMCQVPAADRCVFAMCCVRFLQLVGVVPSDPSVLARLGELYDNEGDKSQAFQYYYDVSAASCVDFHTHGWFSFVFGEGSLLRHREKYDSVLEGAGSPPPSTETKQNNTSIFY